ncbi:hypothetical protein P8M94_004972 [Escherichia coli]|nr:hypothetical protein [Escherichia coli]
MSKLFMNMRTNFSLPSAQLAVIDLLIVAICHAVPLTCNATGNIGFLDHKDGPMAVYVTETGSRTSYPDDSNTPWGDLSTEGNNYYKLRAGNPYDYKCFNIKLITVKSKRTTKGPAGRYILRAWTDSGTQQPVSKTWDIPLDQNFTTKEIPGYDLGCDYGYKNVELTYQPIAGVGDVVYNAPADDYGLTSSNVTITLLLDIAGWADKYISMMNDYYGVMVPYELQFVPSTINLTKAEQWVTTRLGMKGWFGYRQAARVTLPPRTSFTSTGQCDNILVKIPSELDNSGVYNIRDLPELRTLYSPNGWHTLAFSVSKNNKQPGQCSLNAQLSYD